MKALLAGMALSSLFCQILSLLASNDDFVFNNRVTNVLNDILARNRAHFNSVIFIGTFFKVNFPSYSYTLEEDLPILSQESALRKVFIVKSQKSTLTLTVIEMNKLGLLQPQAVNIFLESFMPPSVYPFMDDMYLYRTIIIHPKLFTMRNYRGDQLTMDHISMIFDINYYKSFGKTEILRRPLKVSYTNLHFFTTFRNGGKGLEMLLLDTIAKKLNINITYEKREFTNRFTKISGTYYGPWLELTDKQIDVIIGAPFYTENAELDFDPTVIYFIDRLRIIVPKSKKIYLILGPFDQFVWTMHLWVVFTGICVNFLIDLVINTRYIRLWPPVEEIMKVLLEQGNIQFTKFWSKRILIGSFLLCILLFNSAGKGKIMYFLTGNHYDYQIDTLQEVTNAGYKVALFEKLEFISLDPSSEEYCKKHGVKCYQDDVFISMDACKAFSSGKEVEKVASIKPFTLVIHNTKEFLDKHWVPNIHFITKPLRTIHSKMFFTRGHPLFTVFNDNLLRCFSVGIVDRIRKMDYWMRVWQLISERSPKCQTRKVVLGLDELKFIIHFYQNAVLFATGVFLLEILVFNIRKWHARRCFYL